jgi:hypothetical protein
MEDQPHTRNFADVIVGKVGHHEYRKEGETLIEIGKTYKVIGWKKVKKTKKITIWEKEDPSKGITVPVYQLTENYYFSNGRDSTVCLK